MKDAVKIIILLSIIPLLIGIFFFSNIRGYYRFKHYCEAEGGLKVYEKLERNVGWLADDYNNAHMAAVLSGVAFVRYTEKADGKTYDLKYLGGNPQHDAAFEKKAADDSVSLQYKFLSINDEVPNEIRLDRYGYAAINLKSNETAVRFYMFGYSQFEPSNTILSAPSGITCFHDGGATIHDLPRSLAEITTAFKN